MSDLLHRVRELEAAVRCLERADREEDLPAYYYYRDRVAELHAEVGKALPPT